MTATALAEPVQRADVPVDRIKLDMATQSRDHINADVANGYGQLMADGEWDHGGPRRRSCCSSTAPRTGSGTASTAS